MHLSKHHLVDLMILLPMAVSQIGIAALILRGVRRRYSWIAVLLTSVFLTVAGMLMAIAELSTRPRFTGLFWGQLRRTGVKWEYLGYLRAATFLWCFSALGAYLLYLLYSFLAPRIAVKFSPDRRNLIQLAGGAVIAAPFAVTAFGAIVKRVDFHVREVDIPIENLHRDLEGLRLLQLSDIHLSAFLSEKEFARVIDASNELRAHVGLITGDLISSPGDPIDACFRQLARLRTDAGSFGSMGNHEVYAHILDYAAQQGARLGIPFLRHEARQLRFGNASINFVGVDYEPFDRKPNYLDGADKLIVPGQVNILLSHNPDVFPVAARQGYDLTVAGHTHGGQVTFEILTQTVNIARVFTPYVSGQYRLGKSSCYVTRGIGTIGIPMRLGATPEITLLRLRNAKA
ncbi:MAG: metallophosphoesterase [Acidobacteriota bacterium]|nr:metallophosphoesterase [Acidobacteriota bacterium]